MSTEKNQLSDIFSARLRQRMEELQLRQVPLAERAGVSQASISSWLKGPAMPRTEELDALANALSVSTDWLLGREKHLTAVERAAIKQGLTGTLGEEQLDYFKSQVRQQISRMEGALNELRKMVEPAVPKLKHAKLKDARDPVSSTKPSDAAKLLKRAAGEATDPPA